MRRSQPGCGEGGEGGGGGELGSERWLRLLDTKCDAESERWEGLRLTGVFPSADGTKKFVFDVEGGGGGSVESVLIPHARGRTTLCVSSQVGCAMNCQFCHTGRMGLLRNLSTGQIVEQARAASLVMAQEGEEGEEVEKEKTKKEKKKRRRGITNLVFMGMGEPFQNYDSVREAIEILSDDHGLAIPATRITVSTSGIVPVISDFLKTSKAQLAVSLNASDDETRNWLMPINRRYPLATLLDALREGYPRHNCGRQHQRVLIEYVLIKDINDTDEDAKRLVSLLSSVPCKLNLLSFNPHEGAPDFRRSSDERMHSFASYVKENGNFTVTTRLSRGDEEMSACGQLGGRGGEGGRGGAGGGRGGVTQSLCPPSPNTKFTISCSSSSHPATFS